MAAYINLVIFMMIDSFISAAAAVISIWSHEVIGCQYG